jgi:hypothetical protein
MDVFDIPLFYISFNKSDEIEKHYHDNGFKYVSHFSAVRGKQLDPKKLLDDNIISLRSYNDLVNGRIQHSGIPSLGAIGCSLSHYELWRTCLDKQWPFIIITEEDNRIIKPIKITVKPDTLFISTKVDSNKRFFGSHFYIASNIICQTLISNFFPIDVQVDVYMSHLAQIGLINLNSSIVSKQKNDKSSIQDTCITCFLPRKTIYYVLVIIVIIAIVYIIMKKCKYNK